MIRKPAAILLVLSLAVLALALVPAAGLAAKGGAAGKPGGGGGKPGGGGGGTISLVPDGVPHYGQTVTFGVSTTATSYPWVTVTCTKGGASVYQASRGIFPTSLGQNFTLGPTPSWTGGDAECTAYLENWDRYPRISNLTSMSFHVDA